MQRAIVGGQMRLTLLGIGAMASPRYAPAGLLVEHRRSRVMLDGGPRAAADGRLDAWLVTDVRSELIGAIRRLARRYGLQPTLGPYTRCDLSIHPRRVLHTSHPTVGYLIAVPGCTVVWAPEFVLQPLLLEARGAGWRFASSPVSRHHLDTQPLPHLHRTPWRSTSLREPD